MSDNSKCFFIAVSIIVVVVGTIVLAVFGTIYYEGCKEVTNSKYRNIKRLIEKHPELKELSQEAMTDGILTNSEATRIEDAEKERWKPSTPPKI